ncbi:MAG: hypothetical protein R3C11_01450 [Planctomycetaceae bacterium]
MVEWQSGPNLEKRILPLLDVALSLVGILILMVSVSSESRDSGIEGNVVRIDVRQSGDVVYGENILATTALGIDSLKVNKMLEDLGELNDPLVLIHYTRPSKSQQTIDNKVIQDLMKIIEEQGVAIKLIGHNSDSEEAK